MSGIKIITGILALIGIILLSLLFVQDSTVLHGKTFSYWSKEKLKDKEAVFAILFFATTFFGLKLKQRWASLCGLPYLAIAILPFSVESRYQSFDQSLSQLVERLDAVEPEVKRIDQVQTKLATTVDDGLLKLSIVQPKPEEGGDWWKSGDHDLGQPAETTICYISGLDGRVVSNSEVRLYRTGGTWHLLAQGISSSTGIQTHCFSLEKKS